MVDFKKYFLAENYSRKAKELYRKYISQQAFLVAGLGRCGTTLLTEALINSGLNPSMIFLENLRTFSDYKGGYLYKTHDYPPPTMPENVKVIYLFRNPMNIALSAYKKINEWGLVHHKHFHSDLFRPNEDILERDTLHLERQFDSWFRPQKFSFISVKYENLFDDSTLSLLNDFLNVELKFKNILPSSTDFKKHPKHEKLLNAYGSLANKIERAPSCKVWEPE
ncbi:MAG: hypothetical protein AXA67_07970 [Methylothermaceae bacteria B42]|nr:MAG: hypothetical protein AXA67_07970 [Methylothermaceae bacteria B42]HHJ40429.1 hypothetical protein [Methylothermaceae bacterium]